jgi:hypothetical protein
MKNFLGVCVWRSSVRDCVARDLASTVAYSPSADDADIKLTCIAGRVAGLGIRNIAVSEQRLIVPAAEPFGFEVQLSLHAGLFTLHAGGIEEAMVLERDAVALVLWSVCTDCRLRTDYSGDREIGWTLERRDNRGAWTTLLSAGLVMFFRSLRVERSEYRWNSTSSGVDYGGTNTEMQ